MMYFIDVNINLNVAGYTELTLEIYNLSNHGNQKSLA